MEQTPTQNDADYLAHYLQAVRDLKASPLFTDGQTSLGVTSTQQQGSTKGPITYKVPDPRVRDSVAIPFRRMWMKGEPANFDLVGNIIKRHWPQARPHIDNFKAEMKKTRAKYPPARFMGLMGEADSSISPEDVIDLWLNCRLAHVGGKPGKGRFTRADFESNSKIYGDARFEYLFMYAVFRVGLWFISLSQLAEQLLKNWAQDGIEPSVFFDNITAVGTVSTNSEDSLQRHTPGITLDESDAESRLALLCRRKKYSEIAKLIDMLDAPKSDNVHFIRASKNVKELVAQSGVTLKSVDNLNGFDNVLRGSTISDDFTDFSKLPWRKGMIALLRDQTLLAEGDALNIIGEQLVKLQNEL